jgi:hypothetical protein|tara:strand:+ start:4423 stop:4827 length:405 start_codon:yes stop_codon:yes gene_type:complete
LTDISAIREALAVNLATVPGLRTSAELPDNPSPPIATMSLDTVEYNLAMNQGLTLFNFTVIVIVGRAAEKRAQRKLDAYCSQDGASSIKLAVESDKSLGGNAFDVRVVGMNNIGSLSLNDQEYLAAEFSVTVYA